MLGFTRNEQKVILFLTAGLFFGTAIKGLREKVQAFPEGPDIPALTRPVGPNPLAAQPESDERFVSEATVPLNAADSEELERLPGIGPVMAKRILDYRQKKGIFRSIEELKNVRGIGPKTLEKIRPYLRLE